jgi:hypothetical protein
VCVCGVCWSVGFSIYLNCLFFQHVVSNFFPQFFLPVLSDGRIRTHDLTISCQMLQQLRYHCWPYHFLSVKLSLSDSCSCYQNNPLFLLLLYLVKDYGIFGGKKCQGNFALVPWTMKLHYENAYTDFTYNDLTYNVTLHICFYLLL